MHFSEDTLVWQSCVLRLPFLIIPGKVRVFAKTQTEQRPYYAAARFICKIGCAETDIPFKIAVFEYVTPVL